MGKWLFVIVACVTMTAFLPSHAAALPEINAQPCIGLEPLGVVIEDMGEDGKKAGISKEEVKVLVELKLRQSGIPVYDMADSSARPPYLYVTINLMHLEQINHFVFSTRLDLAQTVRLLHTDATLAGAKTWSQEVIAISKADKVRSAVKNNLEDLLALFLNDYRTTTLPVSTKNHQKTSF